MLSRAIPLDDVFGRLNVAGLWRWSRRGNANCSECISTRALLDYVMLKIFVESDRYAINIRYETERADAPTEWNELQSAVPDRLLPVVCATDV